MTGDHGLGSSGPTFPALGGFGHPMAEHLARDRYGCHAGLFPFVFLSVALRSNNRAWVGLPADIRRLDSSALSLPPCLQQWLYLR